MAKYYGERECTEETCKEVFKKKSAMHSYCSAACRTKDKKRTEALKSAEEKLAIKAKKPRKIPNFFLVRGPIVNMKRSHA